MLVIITDQAQQLLGVATAAVALYDETSDDLSFVAVQGQEADFIKGKRLQRGQGVTGWVVQHGEPALIDNMAEDPRVLAEFGRESQRAIRSVLCVPLQTRGQTIGAIEVINKEGVLDGDDLRMLSSLATPAAAAIMNAQLYERAQQEIAERKRAETALQEERALLAQRVTERTADLSTANAELARAARLKDEFLASMSHELRTPLTAILGLSEVLKATVYGPLTEKQLKSVRQIEESGRHLLALINDILDLSKIEAGKLELQVGPVSVETVCQASLQFVKEAAMKKQLEIFWRYDEKTTTLPADERRLKQILVNLLNNAVKFTPEGGQIGLEVVSDAAQQVIHFTVWDTGIGISAEDQVRLFKPFVQLDSSLSRQYTGTGLGLALVQRMVEMHGGRVLLESEGVPGRGSRFTVSLPWPGRPEPAKPVEKSEPAEASLPGVFPAPDQPAPLILIAEDESSIYTLLSDYLTDYGYRVVGARNGVEALEQAEAELPQLILMDAQMPKLDGLEATRRLRARVEFAAVPIIALTALAMPGDREKCLQAGANMYLSKPINLKELLNVIQAQLRQTGG
jgi:signal transduction histidine kinase/CheY-like chemotaxis protein